jgi:metal-responsive CopG/Arc/MetJ family transcriptional regulator
MPVHKIGITIDEQLLRQLDRLVSEHRFPNRSRAIQDAVCEKIARVESN